MTSWREPVPATIVGGTGDYAGARGWERGTWLDAKFTKLRITDAFELSS